MIGTSALGYPLQIVRCVRVAEASIVGAVISDETR